MTNLHTYDHWIEQRMWLETYELRLSDPTITPELAFAPILGNEVRAKRDQLLQESDWTQLPDAPSSDAQAWAAYRQALRDITSQPGFPYNVTWPKEPAVSTPVHQ